MSDAPSGLIADGRSHGDEPARFRPFILLLAGFVIATAFTVLTVGWLGGNEIIVRISADYPAMVPETTLAIILGGIGVILNQFERSRTTARSAGLLMIVVVASAILSPIASLELRATDGMSLATAVSLLLLAVSLLLSGNDSTVLRRLRAPLQASGLVLVSVSLIGYAMDTDGLFANPFFTSMSILTSVCLTELFLAVLLADADYGWVRVLLADDPGSRQLRRTLPWLVVLPLILCAVAVHSVSDRVDADFRLSLLTFFTIIAAVVSAIYFTHRTNLSERRTAKVSAQYHDSERAREEAETALSRTQKVEALGNLVGGVAHDFNNSLTVILGNLELIALEQDENERTAYVKEAMDASNHAAHLTRQLLAYGRKSRLEPLPNNVDDMAITTLAMFRRVCPASISIHSDLYASNAVVLLDSTNFQQALLNILINARDAMPNGGEITVSTRMVPIDLGAHPGEEPVRREHVEISVSDTGIGMNAETLARAEEPFFTTKDVGEGTGLGLSAVSGFCKQSNGGLRISSEPGVGSTVTMAFPKTADIAPEPSLEEEAGIQTLIPSSDILIVDDEASVARVMARQLQLDGHRVRIANNAEQALAKLDAHPFPDLIITDLVMPGIIQGHKLAEIVREQFPSARILLMSGYESERRRAALTTTRSLEFLQKPIDRAALRSAVAKALGEE